MGWVGCAGWGSFKPVTTAKDVDIHCQTLNPNGAFFFFKVTILTDQCTPLWESHYIGSQ